MNPKTALLAMLALGTYVGKSAPKEPKVPIRTHGNAFAHTDALRIRKAEEKRARRAAKRVAR